jgi:RNA polymerase sigma factor (sigma-70 family)
VSRSDSAILELVRRGDLRAYVVLYERYVGAAGRVARSLLRNPADADDVVSEVFASVLSVIQRGKGPRDGFGPYLMASVRHECYRAQRRRGRDLPLAKPTEGCPSQEIGWERDPFARRDDADVLQQALRSLPLRFREVLWRTEVEGRSHKEIAQAVGTTPQAVAAQAMRARRALGGAYLREHLAATDAGESLPLACVETRRHLPDLVRDSVSTRGRRRLEAHLSDCSSCRQAREDLERLNRHLRTAPGLAVAAGSDILEGGLTARLFGWLAGSSAPMVAATGLVVVSTVVPLVLAHRSPGDDRVATVAQLVRGDVQSSDPVVTTGQSSVRHRTETADHTRVAITTTSPPRRSAEADGRRERKTTRPTPRSATTAPANAVPPNQPAPSSTQRVTEPAAETPAITALPPVTVPAVSTPPIELPGDTMPAVSLPPVTVPSVPSITAPSTTVPPTTVPSTTVPSTTVTVPSTTLPAITLPPIDG